MLPRPAAAELQYAQDGIQLPEGAPRSGQSPPSDPRAANQRWGHQPHDVMRTRGRSGQNRPSQMSGTTGSLTRPVPLESPNNGTSVLLLELPSAAPEAYSPASSWLPDIITFLWPLGSPGRRWARGKQLGRRREHGRRLTRSWSPQRGRLVSDPCLASIHGVPDRRDRVSYETRLNGTSGILRLGVPRLLQWSVVDDRDALMIEELACLW